eukprot:760641-Hanusia_phi.AAC.4
MKFNTFKSFACIATRFQHIARYNKISTIHRATRLWCARECSFEDCIPGSPSTACNHCSSQSLAKELSCACYQESNQ